MKTPNFQFSAILLLPVALLLCQCAVTDPMRSLNTGAVPAASPTGVRTIPVAAPVPTFTTLLNKAWSASEASQPMPSVPEDLGGGEAAASQPLPLPPLIVTEDLNSVLLDGVRYWPTNPAAAAEKKALLTLPNPEPQASIPMGQSGEAWLKSLR